MNDTGPEATPIVDRTTAFLGRSRDRPRHPPEQVLRALGGAPGLVLDQVASLQHGEGVGTEGQRSLSSGSSHTGASFTARALSRQRVPCTEDNGSGPGERGGAR